MDSLILSFSLGHSRRIKDKPFIRSTKNKFHSHITLFAKYLAIYKNWMLNVLCFLGKKLLYNKYNIFFQITNIASLI